MHNNNNNNNNNIETSTNTHTHTSIVVIVARFSRFCLLLAPSSVVRRPSSVVRRPSCGHFHCVVCPNSVGASSLLLREFCLACKGSHFCSLLFHLLSSNCFAVLASGRLIKFMAKTFGLLIVLVVGWLVRGRRVASSELN